MKILLIGGGSALTEALHPVLNTFAEVLIAGRNHCDVELDLTWPAKQFKIPKGVNVVINLAAHFGGQDFNAMLAAQETNVLGALKLAHACARAGIGQLVQVSSIFAGLKSDSAFYNTYTLTKRHAEEMLQLYCKNTGLPLLILRLSQLYGTGESFRKHQPFLYTLLDKVEQGEDIVLEGKNDPQRNFIHVKDILEIFVRIIQQRIEGLYDCGNLTNVRFSEIVSAAAVAFKSSSVMNFDTTKSNIADNAFIINDALFKLIGYFPRITFAQGFAEEAIYRRTLR